MKPLDLLYALFRDGSFPLEIESVNWDHLIAVGEQQLVLPSLHGRLQQLGVSSQLPADVSNFLSAVADLNLERNQAILSEVAFVASLLNEVGVEPVLLKGAAYCLTSVYGNMAARYLRDVDLLISTPQLPVAVEALLQNGFEADQSDRFGRFRHHHPALRRPGSVHFELHHSLGMGICKSLLPASEVLALSVPHDFRGARIRVPSPEHLMSHLIVHSQFQHPYDQRIWPPLRAMYDLVLLCRRFDHGTNWSAIERRFRQAGQSGVLMLHLLQVHDVLGLEPPIPIHLTTLTYFRWLRRKLLRTLSAFRFLDPVYMYSTVLMPRLRLLRRVLNAPDRWTHVAKELSTSGIYKRFITDIIEGYGR